MNFRVDWSELEKFGDSMTALAADATKARDYVKSAENGVEEGRGYLLGRLFTIGVINISEGMQKNLDRLQLLTASSAKELHKCAGVYQRIEKENAARIDRLYPK